MVITGLLAAAIALVIGLAAALATSRRSTHRLESFGTVSRRWLAVHRTENQ